MTCRNRKWLMRLALKATRPSLIGATSFEKCETWLINNPDEIGGLDDNGVPVIVEIDESKYFHRKYHRGQWRDGHWVFGGIERESGKCFLTEVPDCRRATLEPLIRANILPGAHIMSDGWPAYANIDQIGGGIYMHSVVVHQEHFVDPLNPEIHTENVENMWMRAKRKLRRQFGTTRELFSHHICTSSCSATGSVARTCFGSCCELSQPITPCN
ncbi:hypothetical protein ACOMHN_025566 [Nucella lapillus]